MVKKGNPEFDFVFDDVQILDTGTYNEQIRFLIPLIYKLKNLTHAKGERSIELQLD